MDSDTIEIAIKLVLFVCIIIGLIFGLSWLLIDLEKRDCKDTGILLGLDTTYSDSGDCEVNICGSVWLPESYMLTHADMVKEIKDAYCSNP